MRSRGYLVTGALVGYAASRTMDAATSWYYRRQDEESKRREDEIAPGGTLRQVGKQLGRAAGRELGDDAANRAGVAVHRTLGVAYGVAAAALVRAGVRPLVAGVAVGASAFVLVDEGTSLSTARAYPLVSHGRGVFGHLTYGATAGLLLRLVEPGAQGPRAARCAAG